MLIVIATQSMIKTRTIIWDIISLTFIRFTIRSAKSSISHAEIFDGSLRWLLITVATVFIFHFFVFVFVPFVNSCHLSFSFYWFENLTDFSYVLRSVNYVKFRSYLFSDERYNWYLYLIIINSIKDQTIGWYDTIWKCLEVL